MECSAHTDEYDQDAHDGDIRIVTDAEVEDEYPLSGVVEELGKSLKTLTDKLPARMVKVQQRANLATNCWQG